jgi:hypothetical protein
VSSPPVPPHPLSRVMTLRERSYNLLRSGGLAAFRGAA